MAFQGISFLEVKNHMLLGYLINMTHLILQKTSGKSIAGTDDILRLVELRTVSPDLILLTRASSLIEDLSSLFCFGITVTFKHLRSYHDGVCFLQWYFDQCAATQVCHAADTGHVTPPRHSVQTRDRPIAVLSIDVQRHTGIHSYPFRCLGSDPIRKSVPDLPHTPATAQLYGAVMVVVSQKLGRKYCTNQVLNPGPLVCDPLHYTCTCSPQTQAQRLWLLACKNVVVD